MVYHYEVNQFLKGEASINLEYRFRLENAGPLDLTFVSIRLAMVKDWAPVQRATTSWQTEPNFTTTDEYQNEFVWYQWDTFRVNHSIDLRFTVNLTLFLMDYSGVSSLPYDPVYNTSSEEYLLYTTFHPLIDATDSAIQSIAQKFSQGNLLDFVFESYNFTASYVNYKLLSTKRGASFALRQGYGDCDEYTTLFIALNRVRGIPAVEHTAWLADFEPGFESIDEGAMSHAYPMFYFEKIGFLPVDPTRGHTSLWDNWLKTDEKLITLTRGPDHPYRLLKYRWVPVEGFDNPTVLSNYTVNIHNMNIIYYSLMRSIILGGLVGVPAVFTITGLVSGYLTKKRKNELLEKLLTP